MAELIVTLRKINNIDNILSQCANNGITNFRVNLARSSVEKNSELIEIIKCKLKLYQFTAIRSLILMEIKK